MASQGPLGPSSGTEADNPSGTTSWSNPGNITNSDDTYATVALTSTISEYLEGSNFGFSIPAGATIDGIVVEWEVSKTSGSAFVNNIRIVKGGTVGSTDRNDSASIPSTDAFLSYGSSSDLWGETWTYMDINNSGFGAVFACFNVIGTANVRVDYVRITVYYTAGGGGAAIAHLAGPWGWVF